VSRAAPQPDRPWGPCRLAKRGDWSRLLGRTDLRGLGISVPSWEIQFGQAGTAVGGPGPGVSAGTLDALRFVVRPDNNSEGAREYHPSRAREDMPVRVAGRL
jgi:hypothetical protein